ncbi:MAG: hypothetical protein LBH11_03325, partial [Propionibacteriaceae bacterium]|nr:hypothetical protein [Propionibacteriaceae bacterium]
MPSFAGARTWIKDKFQPLATGILTRRPTLMPSFTGVRAWIKDKFQPLTTGTLTRRLILRTAAIMAALAIALGVATSVAMQRVMLRNVDNSLAISQATFWRDPVILPGGHTVNGLSETGLEVVIVDGVLQRAQMHSHGADVELNLTMVMQLRTVPANGLPVTIDIPGFGEWRLSHQARIRMSAGSIPVAMEYIVGVPTRGLYTFTNDVIFIEAVLTLIAVGVTAIVVNVVVRNSLRPLSQMAET